MKTLSYLLRHLFPTVIFSTLYPYVCTLYSKVPSSVTKKGLLPEIFIQELHPTLYKIEPLIKQK